MNRSHLAHIVAVVVLAGAGAGLVEETAWSKTPTKTAMAPKAAPARSYVVKSGDSWSQIAQSHGTTLQHVLAANHATASTPINPGMHVKLPADAKPDAKTSRSGSQAKPAQQAQPARGTPAQTQAQAWPKSK